MAANPSVAEQGDEALTMHSMIKEIQGLKDKFKDEDVEEPSPFQVIICCLCFSFERVAVNPKHPFSNCQLIQTYPSHAFFFLYFG